MFEEEHYGDKTTYVDSFHLPHLFDRIALTGNKSVARDELVMKLMGEEHAEKNPTANNSENAFTGSAIVTKDPSGQLNAVVYTDWVGNDEDDDRRSVMRKVSITEDQLQTMREAREASLKKSR